MWNPSVSIPDRASIMDRGYMKTQINFPPSYVRMRLCARFARGKIKPVLISNEIHFTRRARIRGRAYVRGKGRHMRRGAADFPRGAGAGRERIVITLMTYRKRRVPIAPRT